MTVALKSICIYAEARCLHRHVYVKFIVRSSTRSIVICKVVELGEKVFRVSPPSVFGCSGSSVWITKCVQKVN